MWAGICGGTALLGFWVLLAELECVLSAIPSSSTFWVGSSAARTDLDLVAHSISFPTRFFSFGRGFVRVWLVGGDFFWEYWDLELTLGPWTFCKRFLQTTTI